MYDDLNRCRFLKIMFFRALDIVAYLKCKITYLLLKQSESKIRTKLITFPLTGLIVAFSLSMIPEFRQVAITPFDVTFRETKVEDTIRLARLEVAPEANEALLQA